MSAGARYLSARQGAHEHRAAAGMAAGAGFTRQAHVSANAAEYHDRIAAEIRAQLGAARKLGLGGTGGHLPRNYHGDSQTGSALRPPAISHQSS